MMKTTKLIFAIGILISSANLLQAQVKIGDNPLDIGDNRMYEIETTIGGNAEFLIVTDSLRFGRTNSANGYNPSGDALMMKLYGYGLGTFSTANGSPYTQRTETISSVTGNVFMGVTDQGELLEVPLVLTLESDPSNATLRLSNGTDSFGDISLNPLDSIFATDSDVTNLINESANADGDTITGNEHIDLINVRAVGGSEDVFVEFTENTTSDPTLDHFSDVNLGIYFATDIQVQDTIAEVRNELADTAATLRGIIFYESDGTFTADRTAGGDGRNYDLNFTELDSFNVDESNTINLTSEDDTNIESTTGNINITGSNVNVDGTINLPDYNSGVTPDGSENHLLGVTGTGQVVSVSLDSIGGDATLSSPVDLDEDGTQEFTVDDAIQAANREIDSTIYNYNGVLTGDRTMTMGAHTLTFAGSDTVLISNDGRLAVGRGTFTPNSASSNVMLEVAGDIYAAQVFSSSDARFKKNITNVGSAIQKVQSIQGVTYDFKVEEFKNRNFPTTRQLGFIAQDVEQVVPEVVLTNGDGYKAVDYAKLTALLNEAIKEQQDQITSQDQIIQAQQALLEKLVSQNAALSQAVADIKIQLQEVSNQAMSEE